MTREEIKEMLPIMQAFAEGKTIECSLNDEPWTETNNLLFCYNSKYRIKSDSIEPKYRPFDNQEECWNEMQKHQPFGWIKNDAGNVFNILAMFNNNTVKLNDCYNSYSELFKECKFIDNSLFGIKVE